MTCLHDFEEYEKEALGCWEKRKDGGDAEFFPGTVERCRNCSHMRFIAEQYPDRPVSLFMFNSVRVKSRLLRAVLSGHHRRECGAG
jgi:hypothetical protein